MAFRFSDTQIMLLNGMTDKKDERLYYYIYNLEKEMFTQERSDKKLLHNYKDRQGNRDYRNVGKVFCQ